MVEIISNKTETQTKDNFDLLQDFVDNTSDIILMLSLVGEFMFVNNAFLELLGYSRSEIKEMSVDDILHPEFKETIQSNFEKIKNGEPITDFLLVIRNKQKKRIYLSGDINCRYIKGEPVSFRCILKDITQRRRAEAAQNLYYAIAQSNLNTKSLEGFLSQVHQNLQKNIYANNFFVAVYEPENNSIYFPYHVDEYYETGQNYLKRKLGNGLIEYSILQNKPLIFNKEELSLIIEKEKLFIYESNLPAVQILVPLKINEKTIGVIGIKSYSDENKFSSRDLELLEFVSGQIAIAMERKKSEEELMIQTSRLNAIFDSSTHYIWTVNQKRQLSSFNKNYHNLIFEQLGISPTINSSIEKLGWKLISSDDKPTLREKYSLAFQGLPQYFEMHWGEKDGGNNWFEFYLNPILSEDDGLIDEVSGIARNITEKKNALINLQKSENKFRNTIESFIDIYYRTDLAGNVIMISPSVLAHTGYTVDEVIHQKVDKFFENAKNSSQDIKALLKTGSITNFEVIVKRKDQTLRQFMLNIRMIKDSKGIPIEVEGVARDITELMKSAEDLKKAKNEAEHSLKIKEQFLANMSHEIRTPMNGIIGMIDVLNETPLEKNQKDYVQTIKKSSETLLTILNDILDLSKIEAGKMELVYRPFEIRETLSNLVALFNQKAKEKNNQLIFDIDSKSPPCIEGDQIRLLQILSNLTSNALKFTQNGIVQVKVSSMLTESNEYLVKFEIIDSGIGISEENQKKLFNSFQQLDISTKKSFGGTGLGLVISKELCKQMGGEIGLISNPNEGSNFWFTIKAKQAVQADVKANAISETEISFNNYFKGYSPKILLVDDNAVNRKVASEILKKANCTVESADSGQKAIDIFSSNQDFDVILMDIQMPEMDGIETTQKLKEKFGDRLPKVVAMTAYSMQHDRENFISRGMDDYISKPIRANLLIKKVEEYISGHKKTEPYTEKTKIEEKKPSNVYQISSEIPEFDPEVISSLREMVGQEMLLSVFEDFEKEAEEQIANSIAAFKNNDVVTIQKELHTLKGNSGTIGLMRIHEITKDIEVPAKVANLEGFEERAAILKHEFEQFKLKYAKV
ncbi:PAS domain S-box protein [Lacihabitans sp. CCS-44]|uniref:PAS domain S-box protein n=1 Tax=Lacihabitans sp. CCS-44 TaxID=2487331 RepID=UPI0020CD2DF4|nr:PAS domain S-box protein [Lacihabitans sp. CCS-44]MCP9756349.1 PAS domain S-box protein [Lacihabitans sp. CCS-44]